MSLRKFLAGELVMKPVSTLGLTYQALVMLALVVLFASLTTLVNGEEAQKNTPAAQGAAAGSID